MYFLAFIFIFLLGTIIGSFLNVVIYRFNTGKSVVSGRSICMTCNRHLRWYELIPVFSFLIQSGRCRRCASTISHQYPIVEFLTGLVFALIFNKLLPIMQVSQSLFLSLTIFYTFIFSLLIVISVYDIRHKIIPDKLVYVFIAVAFLSIFINHSSFGGFFTTPTLMRLLSGPMFALPFALLWYLGKGRLMGLGDAKLIFGLSWIFLPLESFALLTMAFWIGTVVSIALLIMSKKKIGMKTEIPFAPFLVLSSFIVFYFSLDVFTFIGLFHF